MVAVSKYINENFIERLIGLSQGEQRKGKALSIALQGLNGAAETKVARGLNAGAQLYARSLSGINFVGSLVNYASSDLETLGKLTDAMIPLVEKATQPQTSTQSRRNLQTSFNQLANKFQKLLDAAQLGGESYLSSSRIEEALVKIGLDPLKSESVHSVFKNIVTNGQDPSLVNLEVRSEEPLPPALQDKKNHLIHPLFSVARPITSEKDAEMVLRDLKALQSQITTNSETLDGLRETLLDHAHLVRNTALAFREIQSGPLSSLKDAEDLAKELSRTILRTGRGTLSLIQDLEPLAVAALTLDEGSFL